jgi:GAF domain-containing protein
VHVVLSEAETLIEKAGLSELGLNSRLNRICSAVVALTRADRADVNLVNEDKFRHVGTSPLTDKLSNLDYASKSSASYIVVNTDRNLVLNDSRTWPTAKQDGWADIVKSYLGVPVRSNGVPVACLSAYTEHHMHYWTSVEITVMEGIAKMVEANFPLSADDWVAIQSPKWFP